MALSHLHPSQDNWARQQNYEWAVAALAVAYTNTLAAFAASPWPTLRLLPISGSIFAGKWKDQVPQLTLDAWRAGTAQLSAAQQAQLAARRLEMCIYDEEELAMFCATFGAAPDDSSCFPTRISVVTMSNDSTTLSVRVQQDATVGEIAQRVAACKDRRELLLPSVEDGCPRHGGT